MCMALPEIINSVVNEEDVVKIPNDTVIDELRKVAALYGEDRDGMFKRIYEYVKRLK